jgi:hypothetical protein
MSRLAQVGRLHHGSSSINLCPLHSHRTKQLFSCRLLTLSSAFSLVYLWIASKCVQRYCQRWSKVDNREREREREMRQGEDVSNYVGHTMLAHSVDRSIASQLREYSVFTFSHNTAPDLTTNLSAQFPMFRSIALHVFRRCLHAHIAAW